MITKKDIPLLSIALFTRNRDKELQNQINSIFSSSLEIDLSFNVFVIDNSDKINTHIPIRNNLEYIYNSVNLGIQGSLRKAFTICNGEYLWLLSDDDKIIPEAIAQILKFISKNKDKSVILLDRKKEYKDDILEVDSQSYFSSINEKEVEISNKEFINRLWNVPTFLSIIILKRNIFESRIKNIELDDVYCETDLVWNYWFSKPFLYTSTFLREQLVIDKLGEKVYAWDQFNHVGIVTWADFLRKYSAFNLIKYNSKLTKKDIRKFYLSTNSYTINKLFRYGIRSILILSKNDWKNSLKNKYLHDFFYSFKKSTTFSLKIASLLIILFLLNPSLSANIFSLLSILFPNKKFSRIVREFNVWYENKEILLKKGILPFTYEAS